VKLALVTNKLEHLARRLLGELGLTERFYTIIGGDTLGPGRAKPAPDLLHLMVERSGLTAPASPMSVIPAMIHAAHAAHLPVVAVSFGFTDAPLETLNPSAIIDHFDELVPALQGLAVKVQLSTALTSLRSMGLRARPVHARASTPARSRQTGSTCPVCRAGRGISRCGPADAPRCAESAETGGILGEVHRIVAPQTGSDHPAIKIEDARQFEPVEPHLQGRARKGNDDRATA
jgi:hypothetical protein